jgi:DNA-binding transcriptional MerR regulator
MPDLRRPERTYTIRQLCIEFKVTPRALRFYEDKGLLSPAREGLNRVYNYRDRARLTLILQGKRVGLSLSDIREILELYSPDDGNAAQSAKSLRKFRDQIVALEAKREDIDQALQSLREACAAMEARLANIRPDLLPPEAEAGEAPRARLDAVHEFAK